MQRSVADGIRLFAAKEYVQPARKRGLKRVQIKVGDVRRALKLRNLTPSICSALRSKIFLEQNRLEIEDESGPPSGMGTRTTFMYRLLDNSEPRTAKGVLTFEELRGLLKEEMQSLGGGENFLRGEREHFYGSNRAEEN